MSMAYIGTILVLKMLSYIDRPFQVLIQLLTGQKGLKLQRSNHKPSMPEIQTMQWVRVRLMVLSATFNNSSAISWWTMQWPKEKGYNLLSQTLYHLMLSGEKTFETVSDKYSCIHLSLTKCTRTFSVVNI